MSQVTAITIDSSALGAEQHIFAPRSVSAGSAIFVNSEGNTSAGNKTLSLGFSPSKAKRKTDRVTLDLAFPLERQVGEPTYNQYEVEDVARAQFVGVMPTSMTTAEREDFAYLVANAIMDGTFFGYMTDLDPAW